jgi:hypothetical protein
MSAPKFPNPIRCSPPLAHPTTRSAAQRKQTRKKEKVSPVGPLLVQHAVPALLAADGLVLGQRDPVVAVAAQVVHRARLVLEAAARCLEARVRGARRAGAGGGEVGLAGGAGRGGLVLFAGHGCGFGLCGGGVGGLVGGW